MSHLIPDAPFETMAQHQVMLMLIMAGAIYYLVKGADMLVDGSVGLAYRVGIPKVIVGATIISLGTTSPEAAVSVMAAWEGKAGLALGNAVGSIIADTGLIFGLGCCITVLPADRFVLKRQGWVKIATGVLLAGLCYLMFWLEGDVATISRWVGLLMLVLLGGYLAISVFWSRGHPLGDQVADGDDISELADISERSTVTMLGLIVMGLALVVLSSRFVIGSVTVLAQSWGVPQVVIAATLVAFGTSLPELVVGMTAIYRGHKEILVGNVIGADILNVLFVIGASAIAKPLPIIDQTANVPRIFLYLHLPTMLLMIGLFMCYILWATRQGRFKKWFGYPLLILYVVYVTVQYALEMGGSNVAAPS